MFSHKFFCMCFRYGGGDGGSYGSVWYKYINNVYTFLKNDFLNCKADTEVETNLEEGVTIMADTGRQYSLIS